ncbi:GMC family oxidoreductase [Acinetobacter gerneri]|jgi:choline dehydrogenase|uniref:GMC family oxidoreductase n=1 Tax=Acinetobacter gerneri TaxID=202952 RepID=UPI0023F3A39E|nr:GMC family oxidoreductase N-terminal domain-containing protein [Acinetobacter gerneri]MCH4245429.1 GMC family oxidoreductase N-terminal domain-containing protein [Acinetobacter gerneri]
MSQLDFDYIICGAGSAGCVVATRLIQEKKGTVLLLEAGGSDDSIFIKMPAGLSEVIPTKTWDYTTEPDPNTHNRRMTCAQGKVLGGSSSVNGMIYIRGHKEDYDQWAEQEGCTGWDYESLLPYFKKSEKNESLSEPYHGTSGPLTVSENRYRHPLTQVFIKAGQELGLPYVNDFNGLKQQGVGFFQTTTHNGERASAAKTYLKQVQANAQLTVKLNVLVHKVIIENQQAIGIECEIAGQKQFIKANKQVILSAGSIGTPKILMLSGIGPKAHLDDLGIENVADLPVGKNYHDHLHVSINAETKNPVSLYGQDQGFNKLKNGAQWLLTRTGVVSSNVLEGGAFIDTNQEGRPDVQAHFLPGLDTWDDPEGLGKGRTHGITLKNCFLRPKSRGEIFLNSINPKDPVKIIGNLLSDPADIQGMLRATKFGLNLLKMPSFQQHIGEVFSPPEAAHSDDQALEDFIRGTCKTTYHPVGTCKMGTDQANSVVDLELKVHGVQHLSVIDCSVFPSVPSGNTNAPTIAVAEKGVDLLIQRT